MQIKKYLSFIIQWAMIGLAAAFIILILNPDITGNSSIGNLVPAKKPLITSYSSAVLSSAPAVVNVYASKVFQQQVNPLFRDPLFQRFFGRTQSTPNKRRDSNLGSGVIMSPEGYILTNAHVIHGKDEIRITLYDGRQATAKVIGIDQDTDLAVLKIELDNLPKIMVGDSDRLEVGDVVLAIGNPFDVGQTVTQGIVSAKGRKRMGITTYEDFIQTDADINPGNSGGALVLASGDLIGINTAIISSTGGSQGIGLATPINLAIEIMHQLIEKGRVVRGWLGIEAQILSPDTIRESGLEDSGILVAGVLREGPADNAGIIPGDIIISVANQAVNNPLQAIQMMSRLVPGSIIEIQIMRGWDKLTIQAKVDERPSFRGQ